MNFTMYIIMIMSCVWFCVWVVDVQTVPWGKTSTTSVFCHLMSLSISRCFSMQVKRLPQGCTGVPERSFTLQVHSQPQQSSNQGLPPHQDTSAPLSVSLPGRTSAPMDRKKCQRMSQLIINSHTGTRCSCQLESCGEFMWRKWTCSITKHDKIMPNLRSSL